MNYCMRTHFTFERPNGPTIIECDELGSWNSWRVLQLFIYKFLNCFSTPALTHVSIICSFRQVFSIKLSDTFSLMCAFTCIEHSNHHDTQLIFLRPFFHRHAPLSSPQTQPIISIYSLIKTYIGINHSMFLSDLCQGYNINYW